MEIRPLRSMLSGTGEFLLYHAKNDDDGPFSAKNGPRFAVSRLPWMAPLTHPQSFGPGGAGTSPCALSKAQQERLWAMFAGFFWRQTDEEWPRHLSTATNQAAPSHPWQALRVDDPMLEGSGFIDQLPKSAATEGAAPTLVPHLLASHPVVMKSNSGVQVYLLAAVPAAPGGPGTGWNVWEGQLRFFTLVRSIAGVRVEPLDGVRWAKPTVDGRLLTAHADGKLRLLRWGAGFGASVWNVDQEHDLSGLVPRPALPPADALRGLT